MDISQPPQVDFTFAVHPGPEVFTGALRTGARRTRTDVFEREAGWERGQPLDLAVIERSETGVGALPFVADVDTARLIAITGDTADLYLPVNEAAGLRVGGVLGYVPRLGSVPGYWGGELDLELSSPFGGGRVGPMWYDAASSRPSRTCSTPPTGQSGRTCMSGKWCTGVARPSASNPRRFCGR